MNAASNTAKIIRRVPKQERGERRFTAFLEAAATVIAESGYEAATMTQIADRAGTSIGALYQYFPNKEEVARALRSQFGDEMEARWSVPGTESAQGTTADLAEKIIDVLVGFIDDHPAYIPLLNAPLSYQRPQEDRNRLRERFGKMFRDRDPSISAEEAFRIANVTLQLVKSMNHLYAAASAQERQELVKEYKIALAAYLSARLRG